MARIRSVPRSPPSMTLTPAPAGSCMTRIMSIQKRHSSRNSRPAHRRPEAVWEQYATRIAVFACGGDRVSGAHRLVADPGAVDRAGAASPGDAELGCRLAERDQRWAVDQ